MSLKPYPYLDRSIVSRFSDRKKAGYLSVIVNTENGEVYGVVTGFSGAESGYGVRHSISDIDKAHEIVRGFVKKGEPEFKLNLINDEKVYRYCRD